MVSVRRKIFRLFICFAAIATIILCISTKVQAYEIDTNYMEIMIDAAMSNDYKAGEIAQHMRDRKIRELCLPYSSIDFEDLRLLAKIVEGEAGCHWLSDYHQKMVASVVLNRVTSVEFPNSIADVIFQEGQYAPVLLGFFKEIQPSERSVRNALFVLENGSLCPSSVVFQAEFKQGSTVYESIYDSRLDSTTYFCHAMNTDIYTSR